MESENDRDALSDIGETDDRSKLLTTTAQEKRLGWIMATVYLAAELFGSGLLTSPFVISRAGIAGAFLSFFFACGTLFSGFLLSKTWHYAASVHNSEERMQDPFLLITEVAYGKKGRRIAAFFLYVTIIFSNLGITLLAAESISSVLAVSIPGIFDGSLFRFSMLICCFLMLPFTWFGTPKDSHVISVLGLSLSVTGFVLILIKLGYVVTREGMADNQVHVTFNGVFSASGILLFSYAPLGILPTIQTDMKKPRRFVFSLVLAYSQMAAAFISVGVFGSLVFGGNVSPSILTSLSKFDVRNQTSPLLVLFLQVAMAIHFLCSVVISTNPIFQHLEKHFNIKEFSWRRCCLRSAIVISLLGLGEIISNIGAVLNINGGLFTCILNLIFPLILYNRLCNPSSFCKHFLIYPLIVVFSFISVVSTYVGIREIGSSFTPTHF